MSSDVAMSLKDQTAILKSHQSQWPVKMVPLATDLGLRVFHSKGWPNGISGMIKKDAESPSGFSIYVNADHVATRRRFTIAHEIAHYILHREMIGDGISDDAMYRSRLSNAIEAQANNFAADVLMPWGLIDMAMGEGINTVPALAQIFEVSQSAMSIRLGVPYEGTQMAAATS